MNGDEQYVPTSWESTETGQTGSFSLSGSNYISTYTPAAAGSYTVTATFTKKVWNGTTWTSTATTDTKTTTVTVNAAPTYTIASISDQTATALTEGYASGTPDTKTVTVTRNGTGDLSNLAAALSGTGAGDFTLTQPLVTTLNSGTPTTTFTIKAKDGLAVGTHTATVTVSADSMTDVTFTVTQVVNAAPTYTIASISDQTATALTEGYASGTPDTKTVTVTRTGTGDLTHLAAALSGTGASDFTLTQPLVTTLNSGTTSTTFTVKAKDGLAAGTHTATVTVSADSMTDVTFTVTQVVNAAPTYTIASISDQTATALTEGYASGTPDTKTVTVTRTGTGDLANLAAALSGTGASDFTLTQPLVTTLNSGTPTTTFTIKAKDGLAAGTHTATVTVSADNMTDVTFTVTQVVNAAPTYTIAAIGDQTTTALTEGYASGTPETKTVTVTRTGTGDLTHLAAALSGTGASDFTLTQPLVTTLNSGTPTTTFTVKAKDGLAAGTHTATVTVSADSMTDVTFTVTQVVNAAPTYTIASISDQTATALTEGYASGTPDTKTVTVTRTGTGDLTHLAAALSGTGASDFTLTQPLVTTLNSGTPTTTFTIKAKDGLAAGTHTATVTVSADSMTDVTFTVTQVVNAAPTYTIASISDQTATALTEGYASGTPDTKTVTVTRTGTGDLTHLAAALSGTGASDFTLTQPLVTTLNSGTPTTTFTIKAKDGLAAGTHTATVTVSADSMTDVTFTVTQVVNAAPTYTIASISDQTATALTEGYASGTPDTKTVTVTRTGTGDLIHLAAALSGTGASDFTLTQPLVTTLNSGTTSTTFTIKAKDGLAAGTHTATVTVSADSMTDVTFTVTQVVNAAPTYTIASISDQTATALTEGYASGTPDTKTVTVTRTGTGDLTHLAAALSGTGASDFTLTQPLVTTLNSGTPTTTFTIKAKDGLAAGTHTATVTVSADNMTDVTFTVTQVVNAAPTYTIAAIGDQTTTALTEGYASGTPETKTVTVTRTGTGDLTHLAAALSGTGASDFTLTQPLVTTLNSGTPTTTFTVKAKDGLAAGTHTATVTVSADSMTDVTFTVTQVVNAAPTYTIASISDQTATALTEGYASGTPDTKTVTVTRTGTGDLTHLAASLSGTGASDFTLTQPLVTTLNSGTPTTTFTIKAKDGLAAGTHTATVTVSADNMTDVTFTVTQVVNAAPTYTIASISDQTATALTEGYASGTPDTKTVTVTRTGTGDLIHLAAALSGTGASDFTLTQPLVTTLNSGTPTTTFTIKAKDGLAAGTHTATVTVSADSMTDVTFTVTQVVNLPNVPANPQSLIATGGDRQVALNWSAVTDATYYNIYLATAPGQYGTSIATATGITYNVQGLTNGTVYYFIVKAGNMGGESAGSNEVSATPKTVPAAPTAVMATAGNGQVTVVFTPPADNGGSPVSGYIVTANPGGKSVNGNGSPIVVTGLTNGTAYTFTVVAVNGGGSSLPSAASNAVTPQSPSGESDSDTTPAPTQSAPTSNATPPPADDGVNVLVNGKAEQAGIASTSNVDGKSVTTISVNPDKLEAKLAAEGNNAVVTIPVSSKSDVVVGELNGQMVKNMEQKQATVEIKTDAASYTLPAQQINITAISDQIGRNVALQDIKIQIEISKPASDKVQLVESAAKNGEFAIVAPPVEFTVTGSYGDTKVEVSKFNAYVERTIAIPDGVDPSKITTGIVVDPDGSVRHVPTKIVVIDGKYYAQLNSLTNSTYSVVWHPLQFKDVSHHWAEKAVNDMGSRMVIDGMNDGSFQPDRDMTRAEFAATLVRALGLKSSDSASPFRDVSRTDWYNGYIATAYQYGIVSGYEDGSFAPADTISREQAMAMIANAMHITGLAASLQPGEVDKLLAAYADNDKSSTWAKNAIAQCLKTGVVAGRSSNAIAPQEHITRAEVAKMVRELLIRSNLINADE